MKSKSGIQPNPLCKCGHTLGQHWRYKVTKEGESQHGCSRCTCGGFTLQEAPKEAHHAA